MSNSSSEKKSFPSFKKCFVCHTNPLPIASYIYHISAKKHFKKLLKCPDIAKRILSLYGKFNIKNLNAESIVFEFWDIGITGLRLNGRILYVIFDTVDQARIATKKKYIVNGQQFSLRNLTGIQSLRLGIGKNEADVLNFPEELKKELSIGRCGVYLDKLVYDIIATFELKFSHFKSREYVRANLQFFLQHIFGSSTVSIFGSSCNGIGFRDADVDLYVHLPVNPWQERSKRAVESKAVSVCRRLAQEIRNSQFGIQVVAIPRAYVPIVKFVHPETKLQVDLSFRNEMPVLNTDLIRMYANSQRIVRPYLICIRLWAKIQDLAGGGRPNTHITNYALTMMMLFWLMIRKMPVIPPVSYLQSWVPFESKMYVDGWDCSFSAKINEWNLKICDCLILELVFEFFEFYSIFDYENYVICPFVGFAVKKKCFNSKDLTYLPHDYVLYCNQNSYINTDTPICVQDPFDHCRNVTGGLNAYSASCFRDKCRSFAKLCKDIIDGKHPLMMLFEESVNDVPVQTEKLNTLNKSEEVVVLDDSDSGVDDLQIISPDKNSKAVDSSKGKFILSTSEYADICQVLEVQPSTSCANFNNVGNNEVEVIQQCNTDKEIPIIDISDCDISNDLGNDDIHSIKNVANADNDVLDSIVSLYNDDEVIEIPKLSDFTFKYPKLEQFMFELEFPHAMKINIGRNGEISKKLKDSVLREDDSIILNVLYFSLNKALHSWVAPLKEDEIVDEKRNFSITTNSKKIKLDGNQILENDYMLVGHLFFQTKHKLWNCRKRISNQFPKEMNPLQLELAVTDLQLKQQVPFSYELKEPIDGCCFLWQKETNLNSFCVTFRLMKGSQQELFNMVTFLRKMLSTLLSRLQLFVSAL